MIKIYAILNKNTGELDSFNGKVAWASLGALQSSFHASQKYKHDFDKLRWKEQDNYCAVDLTEAYYRLEGLEK